MKFFRESIIILVIYLAGELVSKLLKLPIPGNILGMILLFLLLATNTLKLEKVENLSSFFLDHLAFFFIPASVGLMTSFSSLKGSIFKVFLLCIVSTIIVISVTAIIVQFICKIKDKKSDNGNKKEAL